MERYLKIVLVVILLLFLSFPLLQKQFGIFEELPLYGTFQPKVDTVFTSETWFDRSYQEKQDAYLNENFGFRNLAVKINNQVDFSLFEELRVGDTFKGKKGYLYSNYFFGGYSGADFKGAAHADSVFASVQKLNDYLVSKNKKLLICFTPNKESFYPEYLPDDMLNQISKESYYSYYTKKLLLSNIPFIDYRHYFQKIKKDSPYPLFTQGAVHWTTYGAYLALDSLLKRTSKEINKKVNLIKITEIEASDVARDSDDDIVVTANLLLGMNSERLGYPKTEYVYKEDDCYKPKVLIIGDSFFYGLNNTWIPGKVFSKESMFLFYNREVISYDPENGNRDVSELNMCQELENTDIVVLFFSVGTMNRFPCNAPAMVE
ncbi:MAG: alginate O-acetyltransferase AlgX-related protein [Flavobacteriales bacterium]